MTGALLGGSSVNQAAKLQSTYFCVIDEVTQTNIIASDHHVYDQLFNRACRDFGRYIGACRGGGQGESAPNRPGGRKPALDMAGPRPDSERSGGWSEKWV